MARNMTRGTPRKQDSAMWLYRTRHHNIAWATLHYYQLYIAWWDNKPAILCVTGQTKHYAISKCTLWRGTG